MSAIGIDRSHPVQCGSLLDLGKGIMPFGFQDQMMLLLRLKTHENIRHIVMALSVINIRNGKAKSGTFTKLRTLGCVLR